LTSCLNKETKDFGKEIIPQAVGHKKNIELSMKGIGQTSVTLIHFLGSKYWFN
jgi:hypothetical protein